MIAMELERPLVRQCRRIATLWFRWVESQGVVYPRGVEGTWTRIWELATIMPRIEIAHPNYLAQLLTHHHCHLLEDCCAHNHFSQPVIA